MARRKGAGRGIGRGYKNLRNFPKDPKVHSMSAKGMKQPQRMINTNFHIKPKKGQRGMYAISKYFKGDDWFTLGLSRLPFKNLGEAVELESKQTGEPIDKVAKKYYITYFKKR